MEDEMMLNIERVELVKEGQPGTLASCLENDKAVCFTVTEKFLVVGSTHGNLYVADQSGYVSQSFHCHESAVRQVSLDDGSEFVGCCGDDGKIFITNLFSPGEQLSQTSDHEVKAIQLDPHFNRNRIRKYVIAYEGMVVMKVRKPGVFSNTNTQHLVYEGKGPILTLIWKHGYILWSTLNQVVVYDEQAAAMISVIHSEAAVTLPQELFPYYISWINKESFVVAQANEIKVCRLRTQSGPGVVATKVVEYSHTLSIKLAVAGITVVRDNTLMVLAYDSLDPKVPDPDSGPKIYIYTLHSTSASYQQELKSATLELTDDYSQLKPKHFDVASLSSEQVYFILSPSSLFLVKLYSKNSAVVTLDYLTFLLTKGDYAGAAVAAKTYAGKNASLWGDLVYKFQQYQQVPRLAPLLPLEKPILGAQIYELVLAETFREDVEKFDDLLQTWPHTLYSVPAVANMVQQAVIREPTSSRLLTSLARLHTFAGEYDKAIDIFLRLRRTDIFKLIETYHLERHLSLRERVADLMLCDEAEATNVVTSRTDFFPPADVVRQLEGQSKLLLAYLHQLFTVNKVAASDYAERQLELYVIFDRENLLPFLKDSSSFRLEYALSMCKKKGFTDEIVYLLDRGGKSREALQLIISELGDIQAAIKFCSEKSDPELWYQLILVAKSKPAFITALLHSIGAHIDPLVLIKEIPGTVKIDGLRDSLATILRDFKLQNELQVSVNSVITSSYSRLLERSARESGGGLRVMQYETCDACGDLLLPTIPALVKPVSVFSCGHNFHASCATDVCFHCRNKTRASASRLAAKRLSQPGLDLNAFK